MKEKTGKPFTCFFWTRDQFLPATDCTPAQAMVLSAFASYANPDGSSIRPGNTLLRRFTKLDRDTVRLAVKFWKEHPTRVLQEVEPSHGRGHATTYRINMFEVKGADDKPLSDDKGAYETPHSNKKGGYGQPLSDDKGADKGADPTRERGGQRGVPHAPTEVPESLSPNIPEEEEAAAAALGLPKSFGKPKLVKAWTHIWKTAGENPKWSALMEQATIDAGGGSRLFFDAKHKVDAEKLQVKPYVRPLTPEEKARWNLLLKTARENYWTDVEIEEEFYVSGLDDPTVRSIAKLSETTYQTILATFRKLPRSVCPDCFSREQCEHKRVKDEAEREKLRQRLDEVKSLIADGGKPC
jgi:hypothetical protein